ncbi:hypothetical protein F444_15326 [Phytophthora nicotianae P1976]|uniref:Uncharacterized protein n=1 Tax=Phytophthora nicotianae P1976 TaxID=1317066 RepID=A0A080ZMC4_PHYNI|nr:hypothetical protein F444_15326 [Phytophthora nicotianae P1976]
MEPVDIIPLASSSSGELQGRPPAETSPRNPSVSYSEGKETEVSQADQTTAPLPTPTDSSVGTEAPSSTVDEHQQNEQQQQQQQGSKTAGGDVIRFVAEAGQPVVAFTGTNISSAEPTFGQIVSKSGECVVAKPVEYISEEYLDWVWQNRIGPSAKLKKDVNWNVMTNKNFFLDKFVHNNGSINYCVRWDTSTNLKKDIASKFKDVLERHYNKWNKWLEGYNCWPFRKLEVNMVGFAARQASQFDWTDESLGNFMRGISTRMEDIPYGYGYDWGQEVSLNDTMNNLYDEDILFIGHEIGHGFGLPDFYGLDSKPARDFPNSIMMAYSSSTITASDGWMLRRVLDHVKPRLKI